MGQLSSRTLKLAAAGIGVLLLLAVTINVVADFWTPPIELREPPLPVEKSVLQIPQVPPQRMPDVVPLNEQQTSASPQWQWNQPLFEPKFDLPPTTRESSVRTLDFSRASSPNANLPEILPPALPGSDPARGITFRPIFGSKAGGVEGTALGATNNLPGVGSTTGGAAATAGSLLKR